MNTSAWRRASAALLLSASLGLASCGGGSGSGGVGFSVNVPVSYGSMELGTPTTQWAGGPFWNN